MNSAANPDIFKTALQSGKYRSATNPLKCGRVNPDIFEFNDIAKSCPVSYRTINQYDGTCKFAATIALFMAHALKTFYCRAALGTRVNPKQFKAITHVGHASAVADHSISSGHNIKRDHFEILASGKCDLQCKIKETLLIRLFLY